LRLTFAAVAGEPLGPKYPHALEPGDLDSMIELAQRLRAYNAPRRRWLHRYDSARRLVLARQNGLIDHRQTEDLLVLANRTRARLRFAHGDITARNVMRAPDGNVVLIDWEWAGLYPDGYDLAFLWYSLVDCTDGRERVEERVDSDPTGFLLSALLIQLWHLQWYVPQEFRSKHLATRDELLARLLR
jgi:thiamine kinase-like enzyme